MSEEQMNESVKSFERGFTLVIIAAMFFIIGGIVGINYERNYTRPVEEDSKEIVKADSIIKVNDSIKIKVEQLDSIKDAKIIEVQTLDNDSTLKLFYELISK